MIQPKIFFTWPRGENHARSPKGAGSLCSGGGGGRKVEQQACWLKIPFAPPPACSGCHASLTVSTLSPTSTETPFTLLYIAERPADQPGHQPAAGPRQPCTTGGGGECPSVSVSTVSGTGVGWGGGGVLNSCHVLTRFSSSRRTKIIKMLEKSKTTNILQGWK